MSKQYDVNKSLYRVAGRCVNEGQYTLAISCFLAILGNDPVPDDYVLCSLDLARVYIEHTTNIEEAQKVLKQLVCAESYVDRDLTAECTFERQSWLHGMPSTSHCRESKACGANCAACKTKRR